MESRSVSSARQTPAVYPARKTGPASVQNTAVEYFDLGGSINPFTVISAGRNCVSVVPQLNTVAFFRRGGPNDPVGATDRPGNKLLYDVNTRGGQGNFWRLSQGPLFSDDNYTQFPGYDAAGANYAPRYPQGVLVSPAGNTDTAQIIAYGMAAVLDGTNGTWGGLGTGWRRLGIGSPVTEGYWPSPEPLHYISESMEVTSNGTIFSVNAERDASASVTFTDKIVVYRYTYNSTTGRFDSTAVYVPFENEGGDFATLVGGTQIAFGPDGQTGYLAVFGGNNAYDSVATFHPFVSKTTDGGNTWSPFKLIHLNKKWSEYPSPEKDDFRDDLFLGNLVRFGSEGVIEFASGVFISPTTYDDPTRHRVDYLVNDLDITVDKDNYCHMLATLAVSGFGDTLNAVFPDFNYYPGLGSWNVHLTINNLDSAARGTVVSANNGLLGCWGNCPGTAENFKEATRPQITRSADGSVISMVWFDTDTAKYPPQTEDANSNPDLWMRSLRVEAPGLFKFTSQNRNMTKDSEKDGSVVLGNVSPLMLNTETGYRVAATCVTLSAFPDVTSPWPITHNYINGLNVPASPDSFTTAPSPGLRIVSRNPLLARNGAGKMNLMAVPNPSDGQVTLQFASTGSATADLEVFNALGARIYSKTLAAGPGLNRIAADLSGLPAGMYTLKVRSGEFAGSRKWIRR